MSSQPYDIDAIRARLREGKERAASIPVTAEQLKEVQDLSRKANELIGGVDPEFVRKAGEMMPPIPPHEMDKFREMARFAERQMMADQRPIRAVIPKPLPPAPVRLSEPIRIEAPEPTPLPWWQHPVLNFASIVFGIAGTVVGILAAFDVL